MKKLAMIALAFAAPALAVEKAPAAPPAPAAPLVAPPPPLAPPAEAVITRENEEASPEQVRKILGRYSAEPAVRDVQEKAMRYAEVHPEVISSWRKRSAWAAVLPELRAEYRRVNRDLTRTTIQRPSADKLQTDDRLEDLVLGRATWDLRDLVFSPDELKVSKEAEDLVKLREDVLDQVTKLYYERRRLQVDLDLAPPKDLAGRVRKELRLQELTADIDALTGGWFSEQLSAR